jgi:radical SAM superfamily enzyme YgiQ (UPF0313 family)
MINASFVFGMDADMPSVFDSTAQWAISQSIETATYHILTPYPGTLLYDRMLIRNRIRTFNWNLYDTRHCVYQPKGMTPMQLESGYHRAYEIFYKWSSILRSSRLKPDLLRTLRHLAYTGGWKKFETLWGLIIKSGMIGKMRPLLEEILAGFKPHETKRNERLIPTITKPEPLIDS